MSSFRKFLSPAIKSGISYITNGLIGWWRLNGDVLDYSESSHNGTAVGSPTYTTGTLWSQAISFNGSSQYVNIGNNNDFTTESFSISLWLNSAGLQTTNAEIISKAPNIASVGYIIYINSGGTTITIRISDGTTAVTQSVSGITSSSWFFVTMVVDRSAQFLNLYLNGNYIGHSSISSVNSISNSSSLLIGNGTDNRYFKGSVGDVRIYNRVLTATEISQIYNLKG